jgi:7-carboxy-7-deazaguanine synthase
MALTRIANIFATVQGEGMFLGAPSVFVRTSGCNLRCAWCDTPWASWEPEGGKMSVAEIVGKCLATGMPHVVITGGEPMICKALPEIVRKLDEAGRIVTVETAGTVYNGEVRPHLWSLSPKMANSIPSHATHPKASRIHSRNNVFRRAFLDDYTLHQVKFVVEEPDDMPEILEFVEGHEIDKECVYLMPQGVTREELEITTPIAIELAKLHGFRVTPRFHVMVYGNKRGV